MSRGRLLIVGGGQSGLAAARTGRVRGWEPVVLEAGDEPVGSWPRYYDSLRLFSPRRFSSFPGYPFPGDPDGYPGRDEVVEYLRGYADRLGVEVRTNARVVDVTADGPAFTVELADGSSLVGDALIAASGSFGNPHVPAIPGRGAFEGRVLHVADYRSPEEFAGQRVVVVGAGNSAVQVAHELAEHAETSLAVRDRVRFAPQMIAGRDLHWWLRLTRADLLPPSVLERLVTGTPVIGTDTYKRALEAGRPDQRPMFTALSPDGVVWPDVSREQVDAVIFATGYRPHLTYLTSLGVLDGAGRPRHDRGVSTALPGLGFLGVEFQRSFSSNTLRGVHRDARHVVDALTRLPRGPPLPEPGPRPSLGAVLAALCVTEIVSWGLLYYAFPVLAPRISADTGWSSMAVTSAFSAALVVSALVGVPVGRVIDRRGPRLVMTVGSVLGVLALVVIGTAGSLPVFVAGWVLAGAAMAGVLYPPAFAAVTGWFDARRLGALATLTLVAGLASTVFAPLTAVAGEQLGWRATYLWAAATLAVVTVPAHWLLLRRPWPARGHRDAPAADSAHAVAVLRSARFWLLTGGLTAASLAMYTGLLALVPLMLERGLDARAAAWVLGLGGVGQVAGRLVYTGLAHRASLTARTAAVFILVTASTLVLAVVPGPVGLLIAASMLAGVGRGIATLLQATAITDRWGERAYGHLSGVLGLPVLLAAALAPFAGAVLAEVTGSYARAFAVLTALAAVGTALMIASAWTRACAEQPLLPPRGVHSRG